MLQKLKDMPVILPMVEEQLAAVLIAAIIYYLSDARYLSKIVRPAEILSKLFKQNDMNPVVEEDSDKN